MKMVKSLLLGSAAGLVAVAGAQAADLPVKAKPVQYVKICSLYGVGFYYIPGTDMCIKIGGWVRAEAAWSTNDSSVGTYIGDQNNRSTGNIWWRIRGYITADARNQTEYGTVRGYIADRSEHQHERRRQRGEPVRRKPRLHPVGGLHLRSRTVVLRLLLASGARISRLHAELRHRRRRQGSHGVYCAVRQRVLGQHLGRKSPQHADRQCRHARRRASVRRGQWRQLHRPPAAPSRASAATAAGRFRTSSATCVLTRLGVLRRSAAPCTRSTAPTMRTPLVLLSHQASKATVIRATSGATPLWPASG